MIFFVRFITHSLFLSSWYSYIYPIRVIHVIYVGTLSYMSDMDVAMSHNMMWTKVGRLTIKLRSTNKCGISQTVSPTRTVKERTKKKR